MQLSTWLDDILMPLYAGKQPAPGKIVGFAADTDRTQAYVFESNRLPEIRGASRQVAELSEQSKILSHFQQIQIPKECLVFAGGGSILALLPNLEMAETLANTLSRAYARDTTIVSISSTYKEFNTAHLQRFQQSIPTKGFSQSAINSFFGNGERIPEQFGRVMSILGFELRRAKQQSLFMPFIETMPFAQVCGSCQLRPASQTIHLAEEMERGDLVCDVCAQKWEKGSRGEGRNYWLRKLNRFLQYDLSRLEYPEDIEKLTDEKPVALIYADGDSIGQRLQSFTTLKQYETFSLALIEATQSAVAQVILDLFKTKDQERNVCNWEIITIGGDDVLILVPASDALEFSIELSRAFTREMSRNAKYADVRMSVGFSVGKVKTPIRLLYEAARSALKNAKRRAKKVDEACLDWHNIIKEGLPSIGVSTHQTTHFSEFELMTGKPYTLRDAVKLQASTNELRRAGLRSQLYNISSELQQSAARGSLYYYYQRARLQPSRRKPFEAIEAIWGQNNVPWIAREDSQYTIFPDILDLL